VAWAREVDIDGLLKRLHLAKARRAWRELVRRAEVEQWSFRDFLAVLVAEEVRASRVAGHRERVRLRA
jgi:hypothetical protein